MQNFLNTPLQSDVSDHGLGSLCDSSLDPIFWRAERIDAMSAWCEHIPLAYWLIAATAPRSFVELGTHSGVSYAAFCSAVERSKLATRCYAVDTWASDRRPGETGDAVYSDLLAYNDRRFRAFSNLLRTTFDEAALQFPDGSIDLLHINGLRTYDAARHDFDLWLPKLSGRAIVLLHNTNEKRSDAGAGRLWSELNGRYPSFEFLHGHGLGVLAVGAHAPESVQRLCGLNDDGVARTRDRFAMLGERWESERRERAHAARPSRESDEPARTSEIDEIRQRLQEAKGALAAATTVAEHETRQRLALEQDLRKARARILSVEDARADLEAQMTHALDDAQQRASEAEEALRGIESSTIWRATRPLRSVLAQAPGGRRNVGAALRARGARIARQLPLGLGGRARLEENARIVAGSPLFDAEWYVQQYPGASGKSAAHHFVSVGTAEHHDPSPLFDAQWYLKHNPDVAAHGMNPLVHFEKFGRAEGRAIRALDGKTAEPAIEPVEAAFPAPAAGWKPERAGPDLHSLFAQRFAPIAPLRIFRVAGQEQHVTLVIDSVNGGPLANDPRAGLALAATLARRIGAGLRIVTRLEAIDAGNVDMLLRHHGIEWHGNIDFVYSAVNDGTAVAVGPNDLFLTTNWWNAHAATRVVEPRRIVHLLQEDERALYACGEEQLRCAETIATPGLRLVVDSQMLHAHLVADGVVPADTPWFEPAAAHAIPSEKAPQLPECKRRFVFYARPDQPRHLYWRGLEAIGACVEDGILNPQEWEVHFFGAGLTPLALTGAVYPQLHELTSLADASGDPGRVIQTADVALCLIESPHPGYVTLDLASAGIQVVSNRYGVKTSLERYAPNLQCVDPSVASLKAAIRDAAQRRRVPAAAPRPAHWESLLSTALAGLETSATSDTGASPNV
ncbi:class I SAM-dependent methyltransferase [Caballeronia sp. INSB1]|uniref:rhamnosyltransferase WsaF family glycosyltransferase n=1 Tax=Caballeronia sp. INSB1 TaxID=2921751 RepID=UPI00203270D9|nr:class I SAM-dependent methyltransferase [Caballeronia sp. INSB1]